MDSEKKLKIEPIESVFHMLPNELVGKMFGQLSLDDIENDIDKLFGFFLVFLTKKIVQNNNSLEEENSKDNLKLIKKQLRDAMQIELQEKYGSYIGNVQGKTKKFSFVINQNNDLQICALVDSSQAQGFNKKLAHTNNDNLLNP